MINLKRKPKNEREHHKIEEENQRRSELEARNERRDYELDFAPYFAMEKTNSPEMETSSLEKVREVLGEGASMTTKKCETCEREGERDQKELVSEKRE